MGTKPPVVFARWRGFGGGGVSLGRWSASCSLGGAEAERSDNRANFRDVFASFRDSCEDGSGAL